MAKLFVPGGVHHVPEPVAEEAQTPQVDQEVAERVQMLIEALGAGQVGAFKVKRKSDGQEVTVLAAVMKTSAGRQGIAPLVEVITGNAMERYEPPTVNGEQAEAHDPLVAQIELHE